MSRSKPIDAKILEASKEFDSHLFVETIKGTFSDFPDYRRNQKRVLYPIWYLSLVILCGFFCGCNTIEEIAEYAQLQEEQITYWLLRKTNLPFALRWKIFSIKLMESNGKKSSIHFTKKSTRGMDESISEKYGSWKSWTGYPMLINGRAWPVSSKYDQRDKKLDQLLAKH